MPWEYSQSSGLKDCVLRSGRKSGGGECEPVPYAGPVAGVALPQRLLLAFQQVTHGLHNLTYAFLAVTVLVGRKGGVGVKGPLQAVAGCAQIQDGLLVTGKLLRRGAGQRIGAEQAALGCKGISINLRCG